MIRRAPVEVGRRGWLAGVVSLLLVLPWTAAAAAPPPPSAVVLRSGRISITAHGAPLVDVLAEVSRQGGFPIRLDAELETQIAAARTDAVVDDVTPEQAVRRLLLTNNLVFVYTGNSLAEVRGYADRIPRPTPGHEATSERKEKPRTSTDRSVPVRSDVEARPDPARLAAAALTEADPEARSAALETLAGSGDADAASNTAAEVLARERDAGVLDRALAVLSEQEAMPLDPVLRFAEGDNDPDLRMRALSMLHDRGSEDSRVPALLTRLARNDRSPDVRESATALLQELRRHAIVP